MGSVLQIGILTDDLNIQKWEYRILQKLAAQGTVIFPVVIREDDWQDAGDKIRYPFFYKFHETLDRKLFRDRFSYDLRTDIRDLTEDLPLISGLAAAQQEKQWDDLDLVLNFGVEIPEGMYARSPRYGFWSFRVGDPQKAEDKLGWRPETSFEELVKIMVEAELDKIIE